MEIRYNCENCHKKYGVTKQENRCLECGSENIHVYEVKIGNDILHKVD